MSKKGLNQRLGAYLSGYIDAIKSLYFIYLEKGRFSNEGSGAKFYAETLFQRLFDRVGILVLMEIDEIEEKKGQKVSPNEKLFFDWIRKQPRT